MNKNQNPVAKYILDNGEELEKMALSATVVNSALLVGAVTVLGAFKILKKTAPIDEFTEHVDEALDILQGEVVE